MIEAGIDEAGRGSLVSDVYAAAVILIDETEFLEMAEDEGLVLRDSKTLSKSQRDKARAFIETHAPAWAVGIATRHEIDKINILHATMRAMHRAIDGLQMIPDRLLVDGSYFTPYTLPDSGETIPYECIVRGDSTRLSITCAGILAKTHRDESLLRLVQDHPDLARYGIESNFGYGTATHLAAIQKWGQSEFHRKSFRTGSTPKKLQFLS